MEASTYSEAYSEPAPPPPTPTRYINFTTLGAGSVRLGQQLATRQRLQRLLCIDDLVLVDEQGDELSPDADGRYDFGGGTQQYMAVSEQEVADDAGGFLDACQQRVLHGHTLPPAEASKLQSLLLERKRRVERMQRARRELIAEHYRPRHPSLLTLDVEEAFTDEFRTALGSPAAYSAALTQETPTGIYSCRPFTDTFCRQLLEEIDAFSQSGLPVMRPNSMNNYGVVLDEIGLTPLFAQLTDRLRPLAAALYGKLGAGLDAHHAFAVEYAIGKDVALDFHYDDAEVTLNVCLGRHFEGGDLYFRGVLEEPATHDENYVFQHAAGKGLLHRGHHRHGAQAITSGSRTNLIVWFRNSALRAGSSQCCDCEHGDHAGHEHPPAGNGHVAIQENGMHDSH